MCRKVGATLGEVRWQVWSQGGGHGMSTEMVMGHEGLVSMGMRGIWTWGHMVAWASGVGLTQYINSYAFGAMSWDDTCPS